MDSALLADLRGQLRNALDLTEQLLAAQTCGDCGRTARELLPLDVDGQQRWYGPTCHARRLEAAERGAGVQLPLAEGNQP